MYERFEHIQRKLAEAMATGNDRAWHLWKHKLEEWQQEYGAYAPINYNGEIVAI